MGMFIPRSGFLKALTACYNEVVWKIENGKSANFAKRDFPLLENAANLKSIARLIVGSLRWVREI